MLGIENRDPKALKRVKSMMCSCVDEYSIPLATSPSGEKNGRRIVLNLDCGGDLLLPLITSLVKQHKASWPADLLQSLAAF